MNTNFDFTDVSTQDLESQDRMPYLSEPYIGPAKLVDVSQGEVSGIPTLDFEFVCTGDDLDSEKRFTHRELKPRDEHYQLNDKGGSTARNTIKRIGYMLSYFMPRDKAQQAVAVSGSSPDEVWDNLTNNVLSVLETVPYEEKEDLGIKVVGTENGYLNFTRYIGFMHDSDSQYPLEFSNGERQDNAAYRKARTETPDDDFGGDDMNGDSEAWDFD